MLRRAGFVALGGAHLAAERSEEERSGAKWRGRGLGRRNINWWRVLGNITLLTFKFPPLLKHAFSFIFQSNVREFCSIK